MNKLKTLTVLASIIFSGLASAATFEVRYPLATTTSFAAPVVPPVAPPTEPVQPEKPKFDFSPWQNIIAKKKTTIYTENLAYTILSNEITSKNNDVQTISMNKANSSGELNVTLIDPTWKRDWTEFKDNARTLKVQFLTSGMTFSCPITSYERAVTVVGQGIKANCATINTILNLNDLKDAQGIVQVTVGFY